MGTALAALITWVVTAALGFVMVGVWIRRGGLRRRSSRSGGFLDAPPPYFPPRLVLVHLALALGGLLVWAAYVVRREDALAWIALATLVPVAVLGLSMLGRWMGSRRMRHAIANPGTRPVPAESHVPAALLLCHGVLGNVTFVLVLAAALGFES